jgi:hypothetical protein
VYVGIGCTVLVVLGIVGATLLGFAGYRWAKRVESEIKDPAIRETRVKEVLGAERIPDGYHPMIGMSIPFFMDMAILSDRPPDEKGEIHGFGERGFLFFQMLNPRHDESEARDYFEGKTDDPSVLRRSGLNVHIHPDKILGRGVIDSRGYSVMYIAQRGRIDVDQGRAQGLTTLMLVDCSQDQRMRLAIWFGPDPDPKAAAGSAALAGSPADEAAVRSFLDHFHLCPRGTGSPNP